MLNRITTAQECDARDDDSSTAADTINKKLQTKACSFYWCPGLDSNQHTLRRHHLKMVRLPISPPGQRAANVCILFTALLLFLNAYVKITQGIV